MGRYFLFFFFFFLAFFSSSSYSVHFYSITIGIAVVSRDHGTWNCKVPSALDIPQVLNAALMNTRQQGLRRTTPTGPLAASVVLSPSSRRSRVAGETHPSCATAPASLPTAWALHKLS